MGRSATENKQTLVVLVQIVGLIIYISRSVARYNNENIDQLDVTCFIISLFTAQHVSNVSTSIFRSLRLMVDLFHVLYCSGSMCVGVTVWFGWGGVVSF